MNPLTVLTCIGHIPLSRRYYRCPSCGTTRVPFDEWAGLGSRHLTESARRMLALAGSTWAFDKASAHLKEFCHVQVSDDTIERVCQEEGQAVARWLKESSRPREGFRKAPGDPEFSTDGVMINTVDGWREMRLSMLAKREPTTPVGPEAWDQRVLNVPSFRLAFCALSNSQRVGASWQKLSRRMGLKDSRTLSVIADGARWIWEQAGKRLSPQAQWCVDIYHVSEHLHGCGKLLCGEGPRGRAWAEDRLRYLLAHEGPGLIRRLRQEQSQARGQAAEEAMAKLLGYLQENQDRMWYRTRLARGQTIGSGMIEGGCKNTLGGRLKANSARWRIRRVERIGALRCLTDSRLWDDYWASLAA